MGAVDPLVPVSRPKRDPHGRPYIEGWLEEPEAEVAVRAGGELKLSAVTLRARQAIHLPRQWDDPRRKPDASPDKQLAAFARRLHGSFAAWRESLKLLLAMPATDAAGRRLHPRRVSCPASPRPRASGIGRRGSTSPC